MRQRTARLITLITYLATLSVASFPARAAVTHPVISELSTGTLASASQEFVELYNPSSVPIALDGWLLQYKSATGSATTWVKKATLAGSIPAFGFYLVATADQAQRDSLLADGMSATAGHIRLVDPALLVVDTLGYGSGANASEGSPAPAPGDGHSLERLPGQAQPLAGNGTDTDRNAGDFGIRIVPEPQTVASPTEDPVLAPVHVAPSGSADFSRLRINELLPNPASPATDARDEYIELYNNGDSALSLDGLVLACGSSFHSKYTLTGVIAPRGYATILSAQSHLALTNSGGAARLLAADGSVLDETPAYGPASDGQAWAIFGADWQWTATPTPGASNRATSPTTASSSGTSTASSTAKAKTSKATTAKSTRASKAAKVAAVQAAGTSDGLGLPQNDGLSTWLIIGLATLTMGYAIYEYRHRLQNLFRLARSHLASRRSFR